MAQVINIKDADNTLRELVQSLRIANETGEDKDETGHTVAFVVPTELYRQKWEEDFIAVDRLREKMRDNDPNEVEKLIEKAREDLKADSGATSV